MLKFRYPASKMIFTENGINYLFCDFIASEDGYFLVCSIDGINEKEIKLSNIKDFSFQKRKYVAKKINKSIKEYLKDTNISLEDFEIEELKQQMIFELSNKFKKNS